MLKRILALSLALTLMFCSVAFAESPPTIKVTSTSIKADTGYLLTACANIKYNKPKGGGKSPQLSWEKVEGAKYYAVCMFDNTNPWTHWLVKTIPAKKTSLKQGAYTKSSGYIGPYPPAGDRHSYVITVFALKGKPDAFKYKNNTSGSFTAIYNGLNTRKGVQDNIIATGSITGTYARGDRTKK